MTPRGPISFEFSQRRAYYYADENSATKQIVVFVPADEDFPRLFVSPSIFNASGLGSSPSVFLDVRPSGPDSNDKLGNVDVQQGTYYQMNQEAKEFLSVSKGNVSLSSASLAFSWPKPLFDYNISMQGNSMSNPSNVAMIKAGESNSHYLYLPFTVDGEEFSINLRFRVSVNSLESIIGN